MEYMEYDIKRKRTIKDESGNVVRIVPTREDSYERLLEVDEQFASSMVSPEEIFFGKENLLELLAPLNNREQELLKALFVDDITEQEFVQFHLFIRLKLVLHILPYFRRVNIWVIPILAICFVI